MIATVLSAQTTDASVNRVTPALFAQYPTSAAMARALVRQTGFFHLKARRIREISRMIETDFSGRVPDTMEDLLKLPGVGRKTANIVLSAGFGKIEGIAVDTHVFRLSRRIGLSDKDTPDKVEEDLMAITPDTEWARLAVLLILHGRTVCLARKPDCEKCALLSKCLYYATTRGKRAISKPSIRE